jgi:hypothetical protein
LTLVTTAVMASVRRLSSMGNEFTANTMPAYTEVKDVIPQ